MATVRIISAVSNPLFDHQLTTRKRQRSALDGGNVPCMYRGADGEICREVARRGVGAERRCERHYFANRIALAARNRRLGRCRCGRAPMDGLTCRGKPWRSCQRCNETDRRGCAAKLAKREPWRRLRAIMPREFRRYGLELGARLWRAEIVKRQARLDLERAAEVRAAKRRARAHAPLNERQAAFVRAYVLTGNTAGSYREAGYTARPNVAKVEGYWMRRRPHVKLAIAELRAARLAERDREIERADATRRSEWAALAMQIARTRPPHSRIGRMARRIVGLCACGAEPDNGFTTCGQCRAKGAAASRRARAMPDARARERELGRQSWHALAGVREADQAQRIADRSARLEAGRAAEVAARDAKALAIFAEIDRIAA